MGARATSWAAGLRAVLWATTGSVARDKCAIPADLASGTVTVHDEQRMPLPGGRRWTLWLLFLHYTRSTSC